MPGHHPALTWRRVVQALVFMLLDSRSCGARLERMANGREPTGWWVDPLTLVVGLGRAVAAQGCACRESGQSVRDVPEGNAFYQGAGKPRDRKPECERLGGPLARKSGSDLFQTPSSSSEDHLGSEIEVRANCSVTNGRSTRQRRTAEAQQATVGRLACGYGKFRYNCSQPSERCWAQRNAILA